MDDRENTYVVGLCAVFVGTVLGYYVLCKYADIATTLRHPRSHAQNFFTITEVNNNISRIEVKNGWLWVLRIGMLGLIYYTLELVAASFLPVSAIVPFKFLFFVYASGFRLCSPQKLSGENSALIVLILCLLSLIFGAIGLALPQNNETMENEKLEEVIAYWIPVLLILSGLFFISRKNRITIFVAKYASVGTCGLHLTLKDMQTIFKSLLAGYIGGQALACVRIVSQKLQSILSDDFSGAEVFRKVRTYLLFGLTVALNFLHIFLLHRALSDLEQINVGLLMPLYVFFFAISSELCAALYLMEFKNINFYRVAFYSIFIAILLMIMLVLAYNAISKTPRRYSSDDGGNVRDSETLEDKDIEAKPIELGLKNGESGIQLEQRTNGLVKTQVGKKAKPEKSDQGTAKWKGGILSRYFTVSEYRPQLWAMSLEKDTFYMSHDKTLQEETGGLKSSKENKDEGNEYYQSNRTHLDFNYPISSHTMIVPHGIFNVHAHDNEDKVGINQSSNEASTWVDPGGKAGVWNVRGKTYLEDRIKIPSMTTRMKPVNVDWLYFPKEQAHCASLLKHGYVQNYHAKRKRPFMFVLNFMVPSGGNFVTYFIPRPGVVDPVFAKQLKEFIEADDDVYRNDRFKLIPRVIKGNYIVKKAVGTTPALIGRKLTTRYHKGNNWFEVVIDVGSSRIGRSILGTVKGFATTLVIQLAFLFEGKHEDELPERVLGAVDLYYPVMTPRTSISLTLETVKEDDIVPETEKEKEEDEDIGFERSTTIKSVDSEPFKSC